MQAPAVYSTTTDVKIHKAIRHEWQGFLSWLVARQHEAQIQLRALGKAPKPSSIKRIQDDLLAESRVKWLACVRAQQLHLEHWVMTPEEKAQLQRMLGWEQKDMVEAYAAEQAALGAQYQRVDPTSLGEVASPEAMSSPKRFMHPAPSGEVPAYSKWAQELAKVSSPAPYRSPGGKPLPPAVATASSPRSADLPNMPLYFINALMHGTDLDAVAAAELEAFALKASEEKIREYYNEACDATVKFQRRLGKVDEVQREEEQARFDDRMRELAAAKEREWKSRVLKEMRKHQAAEIQRKAEMHRATRMRPHRSPKTRQQGWDAFEGYYNSPQANPYYSPANFYGQSPGYDAYDEIASEYYNSPRQPTRKGKEKQKSPKVPAVQSQGWGWGDWGGGGGAPKKKEKQKAPKAQPQQSASHGWGEWEDWGAEEYPTKKVKSPKAQPQPPSNGWGEWAGWGDAYGEVPKKRKKEKQKSPKAQPQQPVSQGWGDEDYYYPEQLARRLGSAFFYQFGLHCATHQIRIILVSCVVITSLFYPALALYTWSAKPGFLSFLDVSRSQYPQDLQHLWTGHDRLRVLEDAVSRAKTRASCLADNALRVERILINGPFDGGVNHQILQSTLDLERRIDELDLSCLKREDGSCFVLSPLAFWRHNEATLLGDTNVLDTLLTRNASVGGIPITPQMVLAGRGSDEPQVSSTHFDYAMFLALTYFFPNSDCLGEVEHRAWLQAIDAASLGARTGSDPTQEATLIALEYEETLSRPKRWTAISALIYLAYIGFVIYVSWSVRRMDSLHSRIGVTFTALVEIAVTMVPWELLPIVIVFVGAENMFNLVDAVGKTPVTLSVKHRIASGLSVAGTSNTLKVVSYNSILGVMAVFSAGAIRQFCVFAVVVLVAHWFLAHTFFMAVLSIDIQRLELDDLLRQDPKLVSLSAAPPTSKPPSSKKRAESPKEKIMGALQGLLRGRATKNISLLMLLAITATLYYTIQPTGTTLPVEEDLPRALMRPKANLSSSVPHDRTPAWDIWRTLNPNGTALHLRIESPTILTFDYDPKSLGSTPQRSRSSMRLLVWFTKIVILPIAVTTTVLWGILLYLLKDAELLEAQRHKLEPDAPDIVEDDGNPFEGQISFSTLPRAFASDVELIASSNDGSIVVSVGVQNEVVIWRMPGWSHAAIDVSDVLSRSPSTSRAASTLTCVAVSPDGQFCAVGTGAGSIVVWNIGKTGLTSLPLFSLANSSAAVVDLHFAPSRPTGAFRTPPQSEIGSPTDRQPPFWLLSVYENGVGAKWAVGADFGVTYFTPSSQASLVRTLLLPVSQSDSVFLGFCLDDGALELADVHGSKSLVLPDNIFRAGNHADLVTRVHLCALDMMGSTRLVVAAATESGSVSLWDGSSDLIYTIDDAPGRVTHLRVSPPPSGACTSCGKLPLDGFSLAFSVDSIVHVFRVSVADQARRCSCHIHAPRRMASRDSLGRHSRTASIAPSPGSSSPLIPRASLSTIFEPPPFPVSGHGIHSRRASENATLRRSLDKLTVPAALDEQELLSPLDSLRPGAGGGSIWTSASVVRVVEVPCERGAWDMVDRRVVGVRRRPRTLKSSSANTIVVEAAASSGLTLPTLERWEIWSFDLSGTTVQTSALSALVVEPPAVSRASTSSTTSSTSSRTSASTASRRKDVLPRLPFTRVSPFVMTRTRTHSLAGFGNTVGIFNLNFTSG
ncbi:Sterol regulatory element binding protein cleavage-activating protein [Mycena chlorophos]|uniref:Sterol regulatory element-binding protein cleavage-activating protein n=1 Tax=Mycena chlorophos TaxID=658473 RepID=A0A8H6TT47_MYCCL|nr:Sterol regulatory element binding protein cleavage-activating protein [Mycena chlorophos]